MNKKYELEVFKGLNESEIRIVKRLGNEITTLKDANGNFICPSNAALLILITEQLVEAYKQGRIMGMVKAQTWALLKEGKEQAE